LLHTSRAACGRTPLYIKADLPGIDPRDVEITVEGTQLTLKGERKAEHEGHESNYFHREVRYGGFVRTFTIPEGVKAEDVQATYRNGVLELSVPLPGAMLPKKVNIAVEGPATWAALYPLSAVACGVNPCPSNCRADPRTLWPPNHKFVSIDIKCPGVPVSNVDILGIAQDEAVKQAGRGSGNTCPDATVVDQGTGGDQALVRAEREGRGDGRLYFIRFMADVGTQEDCTGRVKVCVPHDQGQGNQCVDSGVRFPSLRCPPN
jgi:hypothetical protein